MTADIMLKDFDPDRNKSMTFQQFVDLLNVGRRKSLLKKI